jgi:tartrate/fumarate subfamily iron-sulfur-dependent hydro-lyase alpha chain
MDDSRSGAEAAYARIEEAARHLYITSLKTLPPDVLAALRRARAAESAHTAQYFLDVILENHAVAERDVNLVCQDTGTVVYWVELGEDGPLKARRVREAIKAGTERATLEHPLRPNAVHPVTRANTFTNTGAELPVVHFDHVPGDALKLHCLPKGSGCENCSYLKMLVPADGVKGVKRFILECVIESGGRPCPPNILGVGLGGTFDQCAVLAKKAVFRPIGTRNTDPVIAELEAELLAAANELGIGPMGLGGDTTLLAVHIEWAHTHITQNPVAVNTQCWAARQMSALVTARGEVVYDFQEDGGLLH